MKNRKKTKNILANNCNKCMKSKTKLSKSCQIMLFNKIFKNQKKLKNMYMRILIKNQNKWKMI